MDIKLKAMLHLLITMDKWDPSTVSAKLLLARMDLSILAMHSASMTWAATVPPN